MAKIKTVEDWIEVLSDLHWREFANVQRALVAVNKSITKELQESALDAPKTKAEQVIESGIVMRTGNGVGQ